MKSSYKLLGDYIRPCNEFNDGMEVKELLGINNIKYFQASHTNTIGIDLQTYRIVRTRQFAYNRATTRNGDKISIGLREGNDCIVSPSYRVFEVKDENVLNSEYLMMWFRRPEFDRYARFKSHGSAHEFFELEQMYEVELPIPHINKQREIVKEYNTILQRINLNNQLIQKLEETAQAIYKQWFVDFEFPNENGEPYKSAGGEMVESELGDIPKGWEVKPLGKACTIYDYLRKPLSEIERQEIKGVYPYYGAMSVVDYINGYIFDGIYLLFSEDGVYVVDKDGHPSLQYVWGKFWVNNHAHILQGDDVVSTEFLYLALKNSNVSDLVTGAAQPKINQDNMSSIKLIIPDEELLKKFNKTTSPLFAYLRAVTETNNRIERLRDILLSKLATVTD